jgi:hypothetical protein
MEKTVQTSVQHVESGSQTRQDGLQPAADDGGTDKPPIPNAGSTGRSIVLLKEDDPVGARSQNTKQKHEGSGFPARDGQNVDNTPDWAHTVPSEQVASLLGTNVQ